MYVVRYCNDWVSRQSNFESKWANLMMLSFCARLYSFFPEPAGDWGKLKPRGVACVELKLSECGAERRRGACPGRETLSSANPTVMGPGGEGRGEKRREANCEKTRAEVERDTQKHGTNVYIFMYTNAYIYERERGTQ